MRRLGVLTTTVLASAICLSVGLSILPAAQAAPPTTRTVNDALEAGKAYDIVQARLSAAPRANGKAKIVVIHSRRVEVGDTTDVWIDTDDDRSPDLRISGVSFSEYSVHKARGWQGRGRDITDRNCATLKMVNKRSVVHFKPSCLAPSKRFSVSVRSSVIDEPNSTDDYLPRSERLTRKVLSYVP